MRPCYGPLFPARENKGTVTWAQLTCDDCGLTWKSPVGVIAKALVCCSCIVVRMQIHPGPATRHMLWFLIQIVVRCSRSFHASLRSHVTHFAWRATQRAVAAPSRTKNVKQRMWHGNMVLSLLFLARANHAGLCKLINKLKQCALIIKMSLGECIMINDYLTFKTSLF